MRSCQRAGLPGMEAKVPSDKGEVASCPKACPTGPNAGIRLPSPDCSLAPHFSPFSSQTSRQRLQADPPFPCAHLCSWETPRLPSCPSGQQRAHGIKARSPGAGQPTGPPGGAAVRLTWISRPQAAAGRSSPAWRPRPRHRADLHASQAGERASLGSAQSISHLWLS